MCQKFLDFWLSLRKCLPTDNSVAGLLKAVLGYHKDVDPDCVVDSLNEKTLGLALQKYTMHKQRLNSPEAVGLPVDTFAPTVCPACHKECDSVSVDCCMKCNRFHRPGKGSGVAADISPGNVFNLPSESIASHLKEESPADTEGAASKLCRGTFKAATATAKRSDRYAVTGIGAKVCRHLVILLAFHLQHGERYGYALAALEHLLDKGYIIKKVWLCAHVQYSDFLLDLDACDVAHFSIVQRLLVHFDKACDVLLNAPARIFSMQKGGHHA